MTTKNPYGERDDMTYLGRDAMIAGIMARRAAQGKRTGLRRVATLTGLNRKGALALMQTLKTTKEAAK